VFSAFANIFRVPELRSRVLFTLGLLLVYRFGCHIPVPGVDVAALKGLFSSTQSGVLGYLNLFSGGALRQFSIFALGVMPYISMSIILQLLTAVIPALEKLSKEGEMGAEDHPIHPHRHRCALHRPGLGTTYMLHNMGPNLVYHWGVGFQTLAVLILTAGTILVMWIGEQITEHGVGNGISIIIFAGIVASLPGEFANTYRLFKVGDVSIFGIVFFTLFTVAATAFVVYLQQGARRSRCSTRPAWVGRQVFRGQSTQLP
jgi:preprotein translocase subunit SecY